MGILSQDDVGELGGVGVGRTSLRNAVFESGTRMGVLKATLNAGLKDFNHGETSLSDNPACSRQLIILLTFIR